MEYLMIDDICTTQPHLSYRSFFGQSKYLPVEKQLSVFIKTEIEAWKPDYVILVERKATAIFRSLKEAKDSELKLDWEWSRTISSSTINQLDKNYFDNKKVLIFDDMMMKGEHLDTLLTQLSFLFPNCFNENNLRIAVFGIHKYSSSLQVNKELGITYPSAWYIRDLSTSRYEEIRSNIVRMLETSGSLLLDTEHIELRIKVKGHLSDLIESLNRTGKTVVFNSSRDRRNITVFYPQDQVKFDESLFPGKTEFNDIVRKCRVVQRHDEEFAIIPICYPSVCHDDVQIAEWSAIPLNQKLFNGKTSCKNLSAFYCVGLIAALQVLRVTVKDLIASGFHEKDIFLPICSSKDDTNGYNLNHLKVMFPEINLEILIDEVNRVFVEGKQWGTSIRNKHIGNKTIYTNDSDLEEYSIKLLQVIQYEIQNKIDDLLPDMKVPHPLGLTAKEIFLLARNIGIEDDQVISSLFDILIDKAYLVTHVEERIKDKELYFVRTFEPDGEIINKKTKDFTIRYGLPMEYAID